MTKKYKVVFTGQFKNGTNRDKVIEHIAVAFRTNKISIKNAIENGGVLKQNIDHTTAKKYWEKLNQLGVICKVITESREDPIGLLDQKNNDSAPSINRIKGSSEENLQQESIDNTYNKSDHGTFFNHKMKILSALLFVIIMMYLGVTVYNSFLTEEGRLKRRHAEYIAAHRNYDVNKAYSILTSLSRQNIDIKDWEKRILTSPPDIYERINAIIFHDKKSRAMIGVELEQDGRIVKRYTQTWIFMRGDWYRAYYEDNHKENKSSAINITAPSKHETSKDTDKKPSFILQEYEYSWDINDSNLSSKKIYRPEVKFRVRNIGEVPIRYLRFKVQFNEKNKSKVFSEAETYAIGSDDISLNMGMLSQTYFIKSDIGLDFTKLIEVGAGSSFYRDLVIAKAKERVDEVYPSIYYKVEPTSKWIEYSRE